MTDRLVEIFRRQAELEDKYRPIEWSQGFYAPDAPIDINNSHDQMFFRDNTHFLTEELHEATNLLKNKPWKQTHVPVDFEKFMEEMGDTVHFFIKSWLYLFSSPDEAAEALYQTYMGKAAINKHRQETNY